MFYYVKKDFSIIQSEIDFINQKVTDEEIEKASDGSLWLKGHIPENLENFEHSFDFFETKKQTTEVEENNDEEQANNPLAAN